MAVKISTYLRNAIIDHMLRNQAFTPPATVYVALFTAVTGLDTGVPTSEVSGGSYARQAIALDAAANGATANSAVINFPIATGDWGEISYLALVDHVSNTSWGTNVHILAWTEVTTPQTIDAGMLLQVAAGEIDLDINLEDTP